MVFIIYVILGVIDLVKSTTFAMYSAVWPYHSITKRYKQIAYWSNPENNCQDNNRSVILFVDLALYGRPGHGGQAHTHRARSSASIVLPPTSDTARYAAPKASFLPWKSECACAFSKRPQEKYRAVSIAVCSVLVYQRGLHHVVWFTVQKRQH